MLVRIFVFLAILFLTNCSSPSTNNEEPAKVESANPTSTDIKITQAKEDNITWLNDEVLDTIRVGESREFKSLNQLFSYKEVASYANLYVLVDAGNYFSEDEIRIKGNNINLLGMGKVNLYTKNISDVMWLSYAENITIRNFRMVHLNASEITNDPQCTGRVIGINSSKNIQIEGCDLNGCGTSGLHLNPGNSFITLKNNYIHNNSAAAYSDEEGGVWFTEDPNHPVITFENNVIKNNGPDRHFEKDTIVSVYTLPITKNNIIIERIAITETVDNSYVSYIPRLRLVQSTTSDSVKILSGVVENINAQILDRFMISSFEQKQLEEFRWYDVDFISEVKDNILLISFAGEYYGAYPNYIEEKLFFNLKTGHRLKEKPIAFSAIFNPDGYFNFLNTYWLPKVKPAFEEAIECADYEPYCSMYDIESFGRDSLEFNASLTDDCYARVSRACSPGLTVSIPFDTAQQYFNAIGKSMYSNDSYAQKSRIERYLYQQQIEKDLPLQVFLFGKIDGKYPISMALDLNDLSNNSISGFYSYDNKKERIDLKGEITEGKRFIAKEFSGGKQTGTFEFTVSSNYSSDAISVYEGEDSFYWTARWQSAQQNKWYPVVLGDIQVSKSLKELTKWFKN